MSEEVIEKKEKGKTSKQTKKYIFNIALMVVVSAIAIFFMFKDNPGQVLHHLSNCKWQYILISLGIIVCYFLVESLILFVLARMYKHNYKYHKSVLNCMIGAFFSGITPSNSGGQFAQAYTFSKQGVKISNAASILLMHFIVYQTVQVLFSMFILIFKFDQMRAYSQTVNIFGIDFEIISLAIIGFVINASVILILFLVSFSKRLHHFITTVGVNIMYKLHLVKDKDQKSLELNAKFESFRIELKRLMQNANVLIITILLFLVKAVLYNIIPYFVAKSLGVEFRRDNTILNMVDCVSMSLFANTITGMIPIPGASGGAELVFKMLFDNFFIADGAQISAIILIWRSITYYFGLIVGLLVFIFYHEVPKKDLAHGNGRTLLQLRIISLDNETKSLKMADEDEVEDETQNELTAEEIEERFKKLKEELASQLEENQSELEKENDGGNK